MKHLGPILLLFPLIALAAEIPLNVFEQSKLETLLRGMPSAFIKKEKFKGYERRYTQFPTRQDAGFGIKCYADFYGSAKIPSLKVCEASVESTDPVKDEYRIKLTEPEAVSALNGSISYGNEIKKFFSHEQLFGQGSEGINRTLFRYSFTCQKTACEITFSTKKTDT